ncbi:hypothetical protein GV828_05035 [Flavobacterium sp. NST-5]|uniref:TonB-dependent receptor n=1 Tax=Flavobacterium ichthyis TaxID=2698827 RepID=A0ABW9Z6R9_9FLAO|nr:carboxypeptidase-like regulatory domain-containing protein [Flavobacterium ichthyis]NBL64563.1 hypothetical protein [Flavobacterium ichthyis]
MPKPLLFFLLFSISAFSQKIIVGTVSDTLQNPLESANILAKPLDENGGIKFAIADNKGRYRIDIPKNMRYELSVSYIGYQDAVFIVEANAEISEHHFVLKNTGETIKEIVITHDYKPIEIKKDTMTFDVKAFANGNERKMKEVLEKLPGVEVAKNGTVTVQGKKVTKMLVEGDLFFGGGSKLAVENIPADAIQKIEVIDNFNEVGFMKQVSDSEDLAMNVKLKEEKKKFIFGDVQAGIEAGNDDNGFYLGHAALFYYSPKTNFGLIADANNFGKSVFTFDDLMRFEGGVSSYLSGRKSLSNLYSFVHENTDVVENKSQFAALNFTHKLSDKVALSGFGLFSKIFSVAKDEVFNQYLQNETTIFENRNTRNQNKALLAMGNVKLDYSSSNNEKLYYNVQFQSSNNNYLTNIQTISPSGNNNFEALREADNISLKQYVEWHKAFNQNHTGTFVVNHAFDQNKPENLWLTDAPFLAGFIPLEEDAQYKISQLKNIKTNSVDAMFKHYWIVNNFNHLYTIIGNNFENSALKTSEKQLLSDGSINDFAEAGFGNDLHYQLNDAYLGLEYKFKIGKVITKPGIYGHFYHLNTNQFGDNKNVSKFLLQPQLESEIEFNKSESLKLKYRLENDFPDAENFANRFSLTSYNSVFKGNSLLQNERFHSANLFYSKFSSYRGLRLNASANFNKKTRTLRNEIILEGINQYATPILTHNPETNWRVYGSIAKNIYKFNLSVNSSLSWFQYIQNVNNIATENNRDSQNIGVELKTANRKWPFVSVKYTKGFNQFSGLTQSTFETDLFEAKLDISLTKSLSFKADYENFFNQNSQNQSNRYEIANASLLYQKKNSAWTFEVFANNLLNNRIKESNSFSDFLISQRRTFILPRVVMLAVSYKL